MSATWASAASDGMAAEEHQAELVVGDHVDEGVDIVEFGIVVRFHVVAMESVGREVAVRAGRFASQPVDGRGCGRLW